MKPNEGSNDGSNEGRTALGGRSETILLFAFASFLSFAIIELIYAFSSNSLSLLGDSLSMMVDSCTYLVNGMAMKRIRSRGREDDSTMIAPAVSAAVLTGAMVYVLVEAVEELKGAGSNDVKDSVVLAFGVANLFIDGANGYLFLAYPDAYKAVLLFADPSSLEADGGLNIRSALTHVLADTWRSVAVIVSALVALTTSVDGSKSDAVGAIVVEIPIIAMCVSICRAVFKRYAARGAASETPLDGRPSPKDTPLVGIT